MTRTKSTYLVLLAVLMSPFAANADLIDTSGDWGGAINNSWATSAQTLNFASDVTLDSFGWWLGAAHTHTVSVVEWTTGPGSILFTTTQAFSVGFNEIFPNIALSAGTQYAVWFDYMGSTISTVHFNSVDGYSDGEWWLLSGTWSPWAEGSFDMRFAANYTEGVSEDVSVPEPGTLALLGIGLAAMGLTRRRKKT